MENSIRGNVLLGRCRWCSWQAKRCRDMTFDGNSATCFWRFKNWFAHVSCSGLVFQALLIIWPVQRKVFFVLKNSRRREQLSSQVNQLFIWNAAFIFHFCHVRFRKDTVDTERVFVRPSVTRRSLWQAIRLEFVQMRFTPLQFRWRCRLPGPVDQSAT
jgi:hypothetical protein